MKLLTLFLFLLLLFASGSVRSATVPTVLGELYADSLQGGGAGVYDTAVWSLRFGIILDEPEDYETPFLIEYITASDVGTTFTYDSGEDFEAVVAILTNGIEETIYQYYEWVDCTLDCESVALDPYYGSGTGAHERNIFGLPYGTNSDLIGYTITKIEYTVLSFDLNYDHPAYSFPFREVAGKTTIYGYSNVVPIPAAVWLFAYGLGLLGWFRRKS